MERQEEDFYYIRLFFTLQKSPRNILLFKNCVEDRLIYESSKLAISI